MAKNMVIMSLNAPKKNNLLTGDLEEEETLEIKTATWVLMEEPKVHTILNFNYGDNHYEIILALKPCLLKVHTKFQESGERMMYCYLAIAINILGQVNLVQKQCKFFFIF